MPEGTHGKGWFTIEIKTANLGDARLNRRMSNVLEMLSRKPTASTSWSETKAAYRFFDNPAVTWEKILQPHQDATIERMSKEAVILFAYA